MCSFFIVRAGAGDEIEEILRRDVMVNMRQYLAIVPIVAPPVELVEAYDEVWKRFIALKLYYRKLSWFYNSDELKAWQVIENQFKVRMAEFKMAGLGL